MKNNSRTYLFILCLLLAGCTSNGGEVSYNDYWIINKDGKELLKQGFETVKYCFNGTAIVSKGGKFGTVGTGGRVIVPAEFDSLEYWSDDVLLALKDGSYYVCTAGGRVMESMPSKN